MVLAKENKLESTSVIIMSDRIVADVKPNTKGFSERFGDKPAPVYVTIIPSEYKKYTEDLETASIDSVVADVKYHDEFQLVDSKQKTPRKGGPGGSAVAVDKAGKEWSNPFEWISSFSVKSIKTRWDRAIAGKGICPICHRAEKPWHVPANCPLLKDLNLKLVNGPAKTPAPAPAGSPTPAPAAASPTPGGRVASADGSAPGDVAPSGLTAAVEEDEYSSDGDLFRWTGDDDGLDFGVPLGAPNKSNPSVSLYPSCFQVSVVPTTSGLPSLPPTPSSSSSCLILPGRLQSIIRRLATSSISPDSTSRVAVADTGASSTLALGFGGSGAGATGAAAGTFAACSAGTAAYRERRPARDAPLAHQLRALGVVILVQDDEAFMN
jgi:hypothetical protein